jgi:hypothetical protein
MRTIPLIAIAFAAACQSNPGSVGRSYTSTDAGAAAWVTITPTKSSYAAHERFDLTVTYRNPTAERCFVSTMPEGTFAVMSVTQNGYAITPTFTTRTSCFADYDVLLYNSYVPLDPGVTLTTTFEVISDHVVRTYTMGSQFHKDVTQWSMMSGGNIEVKLHAFVPIMIRYPGTPCNIPWDPIAVDFALEGQG